jgi:hypothetical protein
MRILLRRDVKSNSLRKSRFSRLSHKMREGLTRIVLTLRKSQEKRHFGKANSFGSLSNTITVVFFEPPLKNGHFSSAQKKFCRSGFQSLLFILSPKNPKFLELLTELIYLDRKLSQLSLNLAFTLTVMRHSCHFLTVGRNLLGTESWLIIVRAGSKIRSVLSSFEWRILCPFHSER